MKEKEEINKYLQYFDDINRPKHYVPYKYNNYIFIFGDCTGIVIFPSDSKHLTYVLLQENDDYWKLSEQWEYKDIFYLMSEAKVYDVAKKYITKHCTIDNYFSFKLPWRKRVSFKFLKFKIKRNYYNICYIIKNIFNKK